MHFRGKCSIKLVTETQAITLCVNNKATKSNYMYSRTSIKQPPIKQPTFI